MYRASWFARSPVSLHKLGVARQPGNPYGSTRVEPYNRLQSAVGRERSTVVVGAVSTSGQVASLSRGPVTPSDNIGASDVALIMRACMADGTLLRPDRSATALDSMFRAAAFGHGGPAGQVGRGMLLCPAVGRYARRSQVWTTTSTVAGRVFTVGAGRRARAPVLDDGVAFSLCGGSELLVHAVGRRARS